MTPNEGGSAREKREREVVHTGEERRSLLVTHSIHLCQTFLYGGFI
jgi:hypothetical protein